MRRSQTFRELSAPEDAIQVPLELNWTKVSSLEKPTNKQKNASETGDWIINNNAAYVRHRAMTQERGCRRNVFFFTFGSLCETGIWHDRIEPIIFIECTFSFLALDISFPTTVPNSYTKRQNHWVTVSRHIGSRCDSRSIVSETVDAVFGGRVPQPDSAIVSAGGNQTPIWGKPAIIILKGFKIWIKRNSNIPKHPEVYRLNF